MIEELHNLQHGDHLKLIYSSRRLEHILNVYLNELLELNIQTIELIKSFFRNIATGRTGETQEELIKNFDNFFDTELLRIEFESEELKKTHVFKDGRKIAKRIEDFGKEFEQVQRAIDKEF